MVPALTSFEDFAVDHIVEFTGDRTYFVVTRYNVGKSRIFLIFNDGTGNTYTRNGRADSWESLSADDAYLIRQIVSAASDVPHYRINANHAN